MSYDLESLEPGKGNGSMELAKSYRIVELRRDDPESVALLLSFVDRAVAFCEKYRADILPDMLRNNLFAAFHARSEAWKLLAAVDEAGNIVAHAIADIEPYGLLGNVVYVLQIEKDVSAPDIMAGGFQILKEWAGKYRIKHILSCALTEANAKVNERFFGFKPYRWLQKLEIE